MTKQKLDTYKEELKRLGTSHYASIIADLESCMNADACLQKVLGECAYYRSMLDQVKEFTKSEALDRATVRYMCSVALDGADCGAQWLAAFNQIAAENSFMKGLLGDIVKEYKALNGTPSLESVN